MIPHRQLFLQHLAQTSQSPLLLEITSADGIFLYDREGKKYIDLISGIGVSGTGHKNQKILEAIKKQVDEHLHVMVYGEFVQSPQVQLAGALVATLPKTLDSVYFVNSGSEAIEGAMKLAKRFTGRSEFVSCFDCYHGSSQGALSLSSSEDFQQNYRPLLPGISHVRFGCIDDLDRITEKTAAFVVETVQGEAGVKVGSTMYWKAVRKRCDETGTLLILDEIQCGFGRTGPLWAFEKHEIIPDVVVSAKGLGGGLPLGCFIASREMMQVLSHNPVLGHISTFGGHPVSCAASLAALSFIQSENLLSSVRKKEQLFLDKLNHPLIREKRSCGLIMALEFDSYDVLKPIIDKAIALGVVTDWFLFNDRSMRIAPPLIISEKEIKTSCDIIIEAIESVS